MAEEKTPRPSRKWQVLLVVSLALNLAVAGVVTGALMREKVGGKRPSAIEFGIGPIGQALTRDERRALGREIRERADLAREPRVSPRDTLRDIQAVLRSEPFDAAALEAILSRTSDRADRVRKAAQAVLVEHAASMSMDERAAFADRLDEAMKSR